MFPYLLSPVQGPWQVPWPLAELEMHWKCGSLNATRCFSEILTIHPENANHIFSQCNAVFSLSPSYRMGKVYKWNWTDWLAMFVRPSSLRKWSISLLVGFTDPYNYTYSESLCWKLIDTSSSSSCSYQSRSPRSPCSGCRIFSTGPSVSPFWDFSEICNNSSRECQPDIL